MPASDAYGYRPGRALASFYFSIFCFPDFLFPCCFCVVLPYALCVCLPKCCNLHCRRLVRFRPFGGWCLRALPHCHVTPPSWINNACVFLFVFYTLFCKLLGPRAARFLSKRCLRHFSKSYFCTNIFSKICPRQVDQNVFLRKPFFLAI